MVRRRSCAVSNHELVALILRDARKSALLEDEVQLDFDFSIAVVNGTSRMPRLSSDLVQAAMRSIEIGSAEAMPTAVPRSLARPSSFASARSISTDVGTAS